MASIFHNRYLGRNNITLIAIIQSEGTTTGFVVTFGVIHI